MEFVQLGFALLYPVSIQQRLILLAISSSEAFLTYQVLNAQDSINNGFRSWRTSRYIYIYRHYLVNTLQHAVCIKNTSAAGASPTAITHLGSAICR